MFEPNGFFSPNNVSPLRNQQPRPSQEFSPAYPPISQIDWSSIPSTPPPHRDSQKNDEVPYNVRVLLDNDRETSSTSSDSEETDTMPEVTAKFKTGAVNEWDFGQGPSERRKSEPFITGSPLIQKNQGASGQQNVRGWTPYLPPKVNVRQCYFAPLNLSNYIQFEKKAYFVTIEGFHVNNSRRMFKLERLCHSYQAPNPDDDKDGRPFLYINLWNETYNTHHEPENLFEPSIYAIPQTQFRVVVTVNMTHSYDDAYSFDFIVDLKQHAFPSKDRRTQNLEVVYSDLGSSNNSLVIGAIGNNITLHTQITNERLTVPYGYKNVQDTRNHGKQDIFFDYTTILRQIIISLPLSRVEKSSQSLLQFSTPQVHKTHDVYAKRGSAIMLGQHQVARFMEEGPQSPVSWSNFTPEGSPVKGFAPQSQSNSQAEPMMPPGINCNNNGPNDSQNYMPGGSLFKFRAQGQQRLSIQAIGETRVPQEKVVKRPNRYQSSDLSVLLEGDKSPLKVLEAYAQAVNNNRRRGSQTSEVSTPNNNVLSRFQSPSGPGASGTNTPAKSLSIADASSRTSSMVEVYPEDENGSKSNIEDFRIEEYSGRMVEFAQTYQGSKVLQKYITSNDKEKLEPVVQELSEKIGDLLLDPYANYMIQTLVQYASPSQRLHILQSMSSCFSNIARDKKGTHSLQAIVAHIDSQNEFNLIKNMIGNSVFELSMDPRANYVIQKLINTIPAESSQFLYQPLFNNFVHVANDSFGLLVIKQVISRVENNASLKQKVIELTCNNFEKLIQNQYGNYAIQYAIEFYPKESHAITSKVVAKIIPYSSQKISSNVIEKCLMVCGDQFRKRVVEEILKSGRFGDLLKNKYGNFVTLQLLAVSDNLAKSMLMQEIFKCAHSFNGTKYKNRWLTFVEQNPLNIKWQGNMGPNQEESTVLEQINEIDDAQSDDMDQGDQIKLRRHINEKKLEEVKKIWREMTKDEKTDSVPTFHGKSSHKKKHYN